MRNEQRESTRQQIVRAALVVIAESGFDGASTRVIAERANVSQGLLTYHFKSKDALWRAAADYVFAWGNEALATALSAGQSSDPKEPKRELIRQLVYFSAEHPELMLFMLKHGKEDSERSRWLIDTYSRPLYEKFSKVMHDIPKKERVHAFYVIAGASCTIFNIPFECKWVTGVDPFSKTAIKRHADYLAKLMIPD